MNLTIRYIPSAFDSAGGVLETWNYYPEMVVEMVKDLSKQEPDIDFGVLANAFTEATNLKDYYKILSPDIKVYSDSGGLQVITLGKEITPEIKEKVFKLQSEYSDYAMSFDEIPKKVLSRSSNTFGLDNIWVDSWFKIKAIESGKNIVNQIQEFKKNKNNKAKILFIIQARNFETAREWSWFMFQEIKKEPDYEKYIGGLALGSTMSAGTRFLTDFILRFQYELDFLPDAWLKKVHILGAGSISKIFGSLIVTDKYFKPGTVISADSTTQTRGTIFGNFVYLDESKLVSISIGRDINPYSTKSVEVIYEYMKPYLEKYKTKYNIQVNNIDDFRNHYTEFNDDLLRLKPDFMAIYGEENGKYQYKKRTRIARFLGSVTMMSHFIKSLEFIKRNASKYRETSDKKYLRKIEKMLPKNSFKSAIRLINISSHKEYTEGVTIKTGHPYDTILPIDLRGNDIVSYKGEDYITDFYDGKLLGRVIYDMSAKSDIITPQTKRDRVLYPLQSITIDVRKTDKIEKKDQMDEW